MYLHEACLSFFKLDTCSTVLERGMTTIKLYTFESGQGNYIHLAPMAFTIIFIAG
jgi:hypothetical protein